MNVELQEYVKQYGIIIESWYPFDGRGHTSEHFNNSVIKELSTKYNKTAAQIILRWQLQAGYNHLEKLQFYSNKISERLYFQRFFTFIL